jgi:DNA-binding beta-propeller fold protein YncE
MPAQRHRLAGLVLELAVVADSNSFGGTGPQWLSVVNVRDALAGKPALVGQIPAGGFPRHLALSPDGGTLYVTNFDSGQLETIDVADLVKDATYG